MKTQTITAIKSLVLAALLSVVPACQMASVNTNGANTNTAIVNTANVNKDAVPPVAENNSNTVAPVSDDNSDSKTETKSDEKLAQRIVGKWEGKSAEGNISGFDFKADNQVYATGDNASKEPAKYKIIDEENVEITTPYKNPTTIKIKVNGDKMNVAADDEKFELTKVN